MAGANITRQDFREDRHGRTFADVPNDPEQPFDAVIDRQPRRPTMPVHQHLEVNESQGVALVRLLDRQLYGLVVG
jgi:hypothetical protein